MSQERMELCRSDEANAVSFASSVFFLSEAIASLLRKERIHDRGEAELI